MSRAARTFVLCVLAALAEGYDLQSAGVAAPRFAPLFHLDPAHLTWVFGGNTFGLFVGAIAGGRLADQFGRRGVLIASLAAFGAFSIATAFAPDASLLIAMRFLTGLGLGGALPNIIALTAEAGQDAHAARRVTLVSSGMPFGGAVAGLVMATWPGIGWQAIFWIGGLLPLVLAVVMIKALPESQTFVRQDRIDARQALWGEGRSLTTLLLWLAFFFTLLVLYLMLNWLPSLLVTRGFTRPQATLAALSFTLGGGIGGLIIGSMAGIRWRGWLCAVTWLGMAAGMAWLASVGHDVTQAYVAAFVAGLFVIGGQFLLYGLSAEPYPPELRATGVGFAVGVGRLGSIAGPLFAGVLLTSGGDPRTVLLGLVPMILVATFAAVLVGRRKPASAG